LLYISMALTYERRHSQSHQDKFHMAAILDFLSVGI